ncbi:MAG: alpha/beta fold hydrolase [Clostridia bacterium]|nr:alpha/beta fold hydrolase [Clostridia bacterium]
MKPFVFVLLGGFALYLLLCLLMIRLSLRRRRDNPDSVFRLLEGTPMAGYLPAIRQAREWFPAQKHEDVFINSFDGLRLHATLVRQAQPRGTVILCHGYHSSGAADFSCAMRPLFARGFQLLVIDQRAHLKSGGKWLTMGVKERRDVQSWADWVARQFGPEHPIVLEGMSMGAATVLMTADLPLPASVRCIVADCGYTSPRAIFTAVIGSRFPFPQLLLWGASPMCRLVAGFSIDGADARISLARTKLPVLLIHGEADTFVPCAMSRENYAAAVGEKTLITVPGAAHGMSYLVDEPKVTAALDVFLDRHIPRK